MAITPQYAYDFDPYGTNANNRITDERHTITPANGQDFNYFIPKFAPFHRRNFVMRALNASGVTIGTLTATQDFYFGFRYDQMILSGAMQPIYGAIVMNDPAYAGNVAIDYQTVGGEYVLSPSQVLTIMANNLLDPRTAQWTAVTGAPTAVPPVPHVHNAMTTMVGLDSVVDSLYVVIDSISGGFNKAFQALQEHIRDHNNPHQVTAAQVGVDGDGTLIPATVQMVIDGTDNNRYVTPYLLSQFKGSVIQPLINAHASRIDNPHQVTAAQVGLGNVPNYPVATATEAQGGLATNRLITPDTLLAAMQYQVPQLVAFHTNDHNNPHQVTKAQVGLSNVPNYPVASTQAAIAGTDNTSLMTPYLVAQAVAAGSGQGLSAHILDHNNPHQVTAAQVGLGNVPNYGIASTQAAIAGTDNASLMTPYLVAQAVATGSSAALTAHLVDHTNPHQVTAAQVGLGNVPNYGIATVQAAITGTDTTSLMTPYLVAQAVAAGSGQGLSAHLVDYANPHRVTKAQVGLSNVQNYPMATATDIQLMNNSQAYVSPADLGGLAKVIQDNLSGNLLPAIPQTSIAFTMSPDLYSRVSTRFPYEYALDTPQLYGSRWKVYSDGYGPANVGARAVLYEYLYPDGTENLQGTLSMADATMMGLVLGDMRYIDSNNVSQKAVVVARVQAALLDFCLMNTSDGTLVPLSSIAGVALPASSSPRTWRIQYNTDTNGEVTGWTVTVDGKALAMTLVQFSADPATQGTTPNVALGFAVKAPSTSPRFTITNWLTTNVVLVDLSKGTDACYKYASATGWVATSWDVARASLIKGSWYHNRFTQETFGGLSATEAVPMGGRVLTNSSEITTADSADGMVLHFAGNVDNDLLINV